MRLFLFMALKAYYKKRDFKKTPEPRGRVGKHAGALRYVIQKHYASRLHYDFRLECDGVLKSWAVPKGPSLDPGHKSLAVQVEDHPIDYGDFEGVIPKGQYGGGTVLLWDTGTWEPKGDPLQGIENGKIHFVLHGEKLNGEFALVRMHGRMAGDDGKNWLLFKVKDEYADAKRDILKETASVKTHREMDAIADQRDSVWNSNKDGGKTANARPKKGSLNGVNGKHHARATSTKHAAVPAKFAPQLAVLADKVPVGDEWLHEIKFDGYRVIAIIKNHSARLLTRNGHDWTEKFMPLVKSLEALPVDSAVLDGEVVVLDEKGHTDFQALQAVLKDKQQAVLSYYLFDLPFCDGEDLEKTPLEDRKARLQKLLGKPKANSPLLYSDHTVGDGQAMVQEACRLSLEGIIAKRRDAPYVHRRDASWLKIKCEHRQEFVIIGYTDPQGGRQGFGSLLLGYHDDKGQLVYAGRVGTGFDDRLLIDMRKQMEKLARKSSPTDMPPPRREVNHAHWVEPKLVGEVRFAGWTRDGVLRHPAFQGLRMDKPADDVIREKPVSMQKAIKGAATTAKKPETPETFAGVKLSHPDKVLYPEQGVTKQDLAEYYESVAERMLPHVIDRPLAFFRCPGGRGAKCFFQRNYTDTLPEAIQPANVSLTKKKDEHVSIHDLSGLISLVQIGVLEIHTWNCATSDVAHPDQLIFDLDPDPAVPWKQVVNAAKEVRKTLEGIGLPTFIKTSGGKGFHIVIPIKPAIDWDTAKSFCQTIAEDLTTRFPKLFLANMRKDLRVGKIYIDYHRNGHSATAVAPYSTRAREGAPVSMPISWDELSRLKSASQFTVKNAAARIRKQNPKQNPWRDYESSRIDLRDIVKDHSHT